MLIKARFVARAAQTRVQLPDDCFVHPVFHVNRLKPWTDPDMVKYKKKPRKLPADFGFKDGDDWEVEEILDDDFIRGDQYYHVRWVGGAVDWLPRENLLPGAKKMLAVYDKAHGIVSGVGKKKKKKTRKK